MHIYKSVEEVEEESRKAGFDLEYTQLGKGKYFGTFPAQTHSQSIFIVESTSIEVAAKGRIDDDTYMVTGGSESLIFNGKPNQRDELVIYPPGTELHAATCGSCHLAQICMPATVVESYLKASDLDAENRHASNPIRFTLSPDVTSWFRSSVRLLAKAEEPDDGLAQNLEHHMLAYLTRIDRLSLGNGDVRGRGRPVEYYDRTFRLTLDYIHANLRSQVALDELCLATNISLRTLQRIFTKRTGMSPRKYILTSKLNAIRRELMDASCHEATVSAVALKYKLNHLSRFSSTYQALFQEYPSDTLSRKRTARTRPSQLG